MIVNLIAKAAEVVLSRLQGTPSGRSLLSSIGQAIQQQGQLNLGESLKHLGDQSLIERYVSIHSPDQVSIGKDCHIAEFVHFWGGGGISVGDRVLIGSHTAVTSITHNYHSSQMHSTSVAKTVTIENDVWIGTHVVILPGVTVGTGAVVGANTVVTKNVAPMTIVVGAPARVIGHRGLADFQQNKSSF